MTVDPAVMSNLYNRLGVSSTEVEPTSVPEDPSMAAQVYGEFEELPLAQQLALYVAPGTGQALAAYETPMFAGETKEALEEGNIPRALGQGALTGLSALGMIPGLGLGIRSVKAGVKAATKGLRKLDTAKIVDDKALTNIPKIEETLSTDQAIKKFYKLEDDISIEKYYDDLLKDDKYVGRKVARTQEEIKNKRKEVSIGKQTSKDDLANEKITQKDYDDIMEGLNKTTKDLDGRSRVMKSAEKLKNKEITSKQHRQVTAKAMDDPKILDEVPTPSTSEEMAAALGKKRHKGIIGLNKNLEQGTLTDVRLDIPAYNEHGIYIAAVTPVGGKVMYAPTAILKGPLKEDGTRGFVEFISSSPSSLKIAEGAGKSPFATMRGEWQNINPKTAVQKSELVKDADNWVQIGFNPDRAGQFYNKITKEPIFRAEEVIQVGEHVLAKNIQKATKTELRKLRVGKEKPRMFKKGGSVVERNPYTHNMKAI